MQENPINNISKLIKEKIPVIMLYGIEDKTVDYFSNRKLLEKAYDNRMDSVLYYATLMGIDFSLIEAAKIEGANRYQVIRHIMLPHLVPLIIILFIMKIGNIFRADFVLFYQIPRNVGTLYETTDVLDTYIYRTMRVIGDMGLSSAAGLLQSFVGFILVLITNGIVKKIDPDRSLF